jgi:hypothetical protein
MRTRRSSGFSVRLLLAVLLTLVGACDSSSRRSTTPGQPNLPASPHSASEDRVYQVGRKIKDFPEAEDLSTPEAAVAAMSRAMVRGGSWSHLLTPRALAQARGATRGQPKPAVYARRWLNEEILEVQIHGGTRAAVYKLWPPEFWGLYFSASFLELHDGKWLQDAGSEFSDIQVVRAGFPRWWRYREHEKARRALVKDPERHLEPFVSFLRAEGQDPQAYVLKAVAEHQLVIIGEVHHRPRYWAFNASLLQAAEFPRHVGVIYLELPRVDQALVDQFLSRPQLDPEPVIAMLRDMLGEGWPDQPTLDFFITVWRVNRGLPPQQKLRIVLVDPRPVGPNVADYAVMVLQEKFRNQRMANAILRDLRAHRDDHRHGLLIVGMLHALLNITGYEGSPVVTTGSRLREKLGADAVFAIHQHRPVRFWGADRLQRPALGLFDSAFAALDCRPMAFPLDHGPFGQVPLDAFLDRWVLTTNRYGDAFSAYLYLGPLETELFSPMIPGFYTDEFVRELDRRHRARSGKGLAKDADLPRLNGASYTALMSPAWGQPRENWSAERLGPVTKWQQGLPEDTTDP